MLVIQENRRWNKKKITGQNTEHTQSYRQATRPHTTPGANDLPVDCSLLSHRQTINTGEMKMDLHFLRSAADLQSPGHLPF